VGAKITLLNAKKLSMKKKNSLPIT